MEHNSVAVLIACLSKGVSGSSNSPPLKRRAMTKSGTLEESSGALEAEPQLDPSELRGQVSLHLPVFPLVCHTSVLCQFEALNVF
jgi:hypothetical protein